MEEVLVCDKIVKRYQVGDESIYALDHISVRIEQGEFIVIAGPSGSGKTTFLNVAGLLDSPESGEVFINGKDVDFSRKDELTKLRRNNFGYVFQNFNLLPVLTAIENVEMALINKGIDSRKIKEKSAHAIELVGLSHRMNHRPKELSGGQQQRVAIARAIVHSPSVIFADEPTANLDSHTAISILELLKKINRENSTTILVSTHDSRIMSYASRIINLRDGQIVKGENQ